VRRIERDRSAVVADQVQAHVAYVHLAVVGTTAIAVGLAATLWDVVPHRRRLEGRFVQSQKMEVVGHLAGGIAHDFNNVLTVITSTAELAMVDLAAEPPLHEALSTIRDAGARAAALTRQLLAVGRRQILQPAAADLAERAQALYPSIRVLCLSGHADDAIAEHGVLADGVQFLAKPFLLKELTVRVREILDA
jgi:signal transduction histidine kinase